MVTENVRDFLIHCSLDDPCYSFRFRFVCMDLTSLGAKIWGTR